MKIRLLEEFEEPTGLRGRGEIVDLPAPEAIYLVDEGRAEFIEPEAAMIDIRRELKILLSAKPREQHHEKH